MFVVNPSSEPQADVELRRVGTNNNFILDVSTYVLILELAYIDLERKCARVWVEMGFLYDVHDYLRTFDSFITNREKILDREKRLKVIAPEDMQIPFDVINAVEMNLRSEAHFICKTNGESPGKFYTESPGFNSDRTAPFLSDARNMVNFVNLDNCPRGTYWKHETRTFNMEVSFYSSEDLSPFNEMHLFFKLITANCQPGTNRIRYNYNAHESDFSGFEHPIQDYDPVTNKDGKVVPTVHTNHSYSNADIAWDRLYISFAFKKRNIEQIVTYYVLPFLSFNYMVIRPDLKDETDALLGISSTLVIANVALLITARNHVFTFYEQAILIQILVLVISTLILAQFSDSTFDIQLLLGLLNGGAFAVTLISHYLIARKRNMNINKLIKRGDYHLLNTI